MGGAGSTLLDVSEFYMRYACALRLCSALADVPNHFNLSGQHRLGESGRCSQSPLVEAVVGSVVGLIALFSSYDHINLPHRQLPLQQQWGVWLIAVSLPRVVTDPAAGFCVSPR